MPNIGPRRKFGRAFGITIAIKGVTNARQFVKKKNSLSDTPEPSNEPTGLWRALELTLTYAFPEILPSHIELYLRHSDVSAIYQLSAKEGSFSRFSLQAPPLTLPEGIELIETWWFSNGDARKIMLEIGNLLHEFSRLGSEWVPISAKVGREMLVTVAQQLKMPFICDRKAKERVFGRVASVQRDFEKRISGGELQSVRVGRNYRQGRREAIEQGRQWLPWHAYVDSLKEQAVRESARIWGRGAIMGGGA